MGGTASSPGGVSPVPPPSVIASLGALQLSARSSVDAVPAEVDSEVVVMGTLLAKPARGEEARTPVDIVCVLDRSGSMGGTKLDLCCKTLRFLVGSALGAADRFSLVVFDNSAQVVQPLVVMTQENKERALDRIGRLRAGSATNLSDGIFLGLDQVLSQGKSSVSAVLVLTDGMMNEGISDRTELLSALAQRLANFPSNRSKPSLFTFGYGADCDEDLLSEIASSTGGNFYSVLSLDSVSLAFADVLGGVMSTTCQGVKLTCEALQPAGLEIIGQALTRFPQERIASQTIRTDVRDLFAEERRDILFRFLVPRGNEPAQISLKVSYLDVALEKRMETSVVVTIGRYPGSKMVGAPDVEVCTQMCRYTAVAQLERAKALAGQGFFTDGKALLMASMRDIKKQAADLHAEDDAMLGELINDLKIAHDSMGDSTSWTTGGSSRTSETINSHGYQRNTKLFLTRLDLTSSAPALSKSSVYQTSSSSRMQLMSVRELDEET